MYTNFLDFPLPPLYPLVQTKLLPLFNLQDLASNKAYTIGRRPAYRDYVDIFFLMKAGQKLQTIIADAEKRFQGNFSEKLFLQQLSFFDDLNLEEITFLKDTYTPTEIQQFLAAEVSTYIEKNI